MKGFLQIEDMHIFLSIVSLILLCLTPFRDRLFHFFQFWGESAQQFCLLGIAHFHQPIPEMQALICGKNMESSAPKRIYEVSGLIHLFVVSGSHFVVLEKFAQWLNVPQRLRLTLHLCFLFASGFQSPAVRFLTQYFMFITPLHLGASLRADQKTLFAGLMGLVLFPAWANSFSFLLSWSASLALAFCSELHGVPWRWLLNQILIFLILLPLLSMIQSPHLLSIAANLFLGELLGAILLPLAMSAVFSQTLMDLLKHILQILNRMLELVFYHPWTRALIIDGDVGFVASQMVMWVLLLHLLIHLILVIWLRKHPR